MHQTHAVKVGTLREEEQRVGQCPSCDLPWQLRHEAVIPAPGAWFDELAFCCGPCGETRNFIFDITAFFEPRPGVWAGSHTLAAAPPTTEPAGQQAIAA